MADTFTDVYKKAREVLQTQKFAGEWEEFVSTKSGVKALMGADGPDGSRGDATDQVRKRIADNSNGRLLQFVVGGGPGETLYKAAQNDKSPGKWQDRAGTLKMLRHLYHQKKRGGQEVWVYNPPKSYSKWVFDELVGKDEEIKKKLNDEREIFSSAEKKHMSESLSLALKIAEDTKIKLASPDDKTREAVGRWFVDPSADKDTLDHAISVLSDGFKRIAVACNSSKLVFTDYPNWRKDRKNYFGGAIRGGEGGGFPVIYLEGAFNRLKGNSGKLWLCALTIVHEMSHHEVCTQDHRYDYEGLKPCEAFPYAKCIDNADSWGYFATDLAGYLSKADRDGTLK